MYLQLAHTKLDVFQVSKSFGLECYRLTKTFPTEEKFAMTSQMRRAALSVYLNIAEECSRKSVTERKRYYEIARGSIVEVAAALSIAFELHYFTEQGAQELGQKLVHTFKLLCGMIGD